MNPFCPHCGYRLEPDPVRSFYACPGCGEDRSEIEMLMDPVPEPAHGERCHGCAGTGLVEVSYTEWHPYGDTVVPEELLSDEPCPDCDGVGYFLDDSTCICCGLPVEKGCLIQGWEVHEECSEDDVPTLPGRGI